MTGYKNKKRARSVPKTMMVLVLCLVIALAAAAWLHPISTGNIQQMEEELFAEMELQAGQACIVNATRKAIIYEKEADTQIAPASTAKMLTALTVLDCCDIREEVTVGEELHLVAEDASRAGLYEGNVVTVKQLLEGLLLPSGNDAAYVLAVHAGRKLAEDAALGVGDALAVFMENMNEKAVQVGAQDSCFVSPDGYDAEGQYTTAKDLAIIAQTLLQQETEEHLLATIVKQYSIREVFPDGRDVTWYNTNELLNPDSSYYDANVVGIKTGSSGNAGSCLIAAAKIKGTVYLTVVMGDTEAGRYEDTLQIYKKISK